MQKNVFSRGLLPLILLVVLLLQGLYSSAQSPLLGWDTNPIVNGANLFGPSPFNPTTVAANVTGSGIIRGAGVSTTGTGANRAFGGVGFNVPDAASAIAANKFFAFTVAANSGYNLSLSSINPFDYRRSSTGPPSALIQYSINGGTYIDITTVSFPTTASSGASAGPVDLSTIPALQNLPSTSTVSFRIVPFGASGATGTWYIFDVVNSSANDFVVNGTVTSATSPTLTSTPLTFPSVCLGSNNIQSTTITGTDLTGSSVLVGPFSSYGFSTNPAGPFDPSVTLTYVGTTLSSTVYVQYLPLAAGSNNGNIPMSGGGASGTIATTATANNIPIVNASASPNDTICTGSSVTLLGSGANIYTWNAIPTVTSDTMFTPAVAGIYTVIGTDANGCSASSTIGITLIGSSIFSDNFETGSMSPLWQSGLGTYTTNVSNVTPAEGNYSLDLSSNGAGTFYQGRYVTFPAAQPTSISWWAKTNTTNAANGYVIVGDNSISTNNGILFCYFNATSQLRFFNTTGYNYAITANTWYFIEARNINWISKTMDIYINNALILSNWAFRSPASTNVTQLHIFNLNAATASYDKINVGDEPFAITASASPSNTVCAGSPITLQSSGAITYAWNGNNTLTSDTLLSPAVAGIYTVTGTNAYGCTATNSVSITVNLSPNVAATANPGSSVCSGLPITLQGSGASTYTWNSISTTTSDTTLSPAIAGIYTIVGVDGNGCSASSTITINVNNLPTVTATPATQTLCENANATVTGGGASTYVWTGGISDATPFTVTSGPTTYTVTGTDGNGCSNTATAVVNMNAAPLVTAGATPTTTCNNTVVTPTGSGASTYTWSGGLTDNTPFVATATATYTVTGTDGIGCSATSSVTVTVTPASGTLAPATSNQSQAHNDDFNVNYNDASCNLIATVDDGAGGNILGLTTATVNVEATAGVHNGQPFVRRWYQITPTSNGSADVILYINQADFNDYNAAVTAPYLPLPTSGNNSDPNIANIRITKNSDAGLGNSPVVITPTVNWNGTYWELSFNTPSFSQFRVHSVNPGNVPLPATVTNFSGRKMSTSDMLEWTTASEQNNAYFNLQHGTDGINFTTIAKVNSQAPNGNSSSILNYSFENTKPQLGHNYYRLQQVDIDNHSTMNAKVVDIIWGTNGSTVSIYPNPTQDVLNIDLYTTKVQNTTVKVLDMSGRIVKQIQGRSEAGMNKLSISLGEIASGVYTVQVFENDNLTHVSKVKKND